MKLQTTEVASIHCKSAALSLPWHAAFVSKTVTTHHQTSLGVPLQFFLSEEAYTHRPMKIKLMSKMPAHLRSLAPVAHGIFGDMEVPAIDLPDGNPASPPRLWGLTLGMTSQLISMTADSISGRPDRPAISGRLNGPKKLAFVELDRSGPKYTYPDIAALVWLFFKFGLAWQKVKGVKKETRVKK